MMVTFVSQCEKNALKKTRRVLDAFANRIGDNTWQTIITEDGLLTVKKMLRKTASKNTAVSCHWIRSRSRSHFLWVVGNKRKFDGEGRVPVNSTHNKNFTGEKENRWQHAHSIQIVCVLSALIHDIGKATVGFQKKLLSKSKNVGDPYRHEWISLRLFQAMIHGCNDDESWLNRFVDLNGFLNATPDWLEKLYNDSRANKANHRSLESFPPLAQLIAWLIVTHHRLPTYDPNKYKNADARQQERANPLLWGNEMDVAMFYGFLKPFEGWVINTKADKHNQDFWKLKSIVMQSKSWQKSVSRWARKALIHQPLRELAKQPIYDPFLMHMSRLCLMLADHKYSSLPAEHKDRVKADKQFATSLLANTDKNRQPNQALDEHLIGVSEIAKKITRAIPRLPEKIEGLPERFQPLLKNTKAEQYKWQNSAFKLAQSFADKAQDAGFFGVNMASTGKGKTLGNARIMYALGNPETGPRFTIALGLRVLTLQTGKALRERLNLSNDQLAILVGGAANKKLFELAEEQQSSEYSKPEDFGSESAEALLDDNDSVDLSYLPDEFSTLLSDIKARKLLYAPVVSCTVDHIIQASENHRGGRHIAPTLRLLTSDLVLDEPDDFDQGDLPALARLVYFSGLYGSKVLLSSATLTPDLIEGLYMAYSNGRALWNRHMGIPNNQPICCAWFDEYTQTAADCVDNDAFSKEHRQFVKKRVKKLRQQSIRRMAEFLPLDLPPPPENEKVNFQALSSEVLSACMVLHEAHAEICPTTKKHASIGLIRMANVAPIIKLVQALYQAVRVPEDFQFHICCYHAKQLLLLRNSLEQKLDRILARNQTKAIFSHTEIQTALATSNAKHHVFIVVASPVAEVGRDHDYDWAIVEPSSMRSIIQLAGRIWRHRPEKVANKPNMVILEKNIRALKSETPAYARPGFEEKPPSQFALASHNCKELIGLNQLAQVDSQPRVDKPDQDKLRPQNNLADLEHSVMADLLNNSENFVSAFWRQDNGNHLSAHLQKISPFRESTAQDDFVCLPSANSATGFQFTFAEAAWENLDNPTFQSGKFRVAEIKAENPQLQPWLTVELTDALEELANRLEEDDLAMVARQYTNVRLERRDGTWMFHPWLGFWN